MGVRETTFSPVPFPGRESVVESWFPKGGLTGKSRVSDASLGDIAQVCWSGSSLLLQSVDGGFSFLAEHLELGVP